MTLKKKEPQLNKTSVLRDKETNSETEIKTVTLNSEARGNKASTGNVS